MGSHTTFTKQGRRRPLKKSLSPRIEKLNQEFEKNGGEWREVRVDKLFNIVSGRQPNIHNRFSKKEPGMVNTITGATIRNGISFYSYSEISYNHELTIAKDGEYAGTVFLQTEPFIIGGHCMGIFSKQEMSNESKIYISSLINKVRPMWAGNDRPSVQKSRLEKLKILLPVENPVKNKYKIAFSYMKNYIKALEAERIETLEAYLMVTGLKDYHLTEKDEQILDTFAKLSDTESRVEYLGILRPFTMKQLFSHIKQGRRLKKDDQLSGSLPFVMAGTTNTGVVNSISNDVEIFPKHAITIDIFGNTFYRNYEFGAGDDTGVFWNDNLNEDEVKSLLYLKTVIEKELVGKYDFGHKLRASQTHQMTFYIPSISKEKADTSFMADFIKAIEKLVIKDLIEWTDMKIEATKEVVSRV